MQPMISTDERFVIAGLPHQIPQLQLQVQTSGQQQQLLQPVFAVIATDVQQNRQQSAWRALLFNTMADNYWQNQTAGQMISFALDYTEHLMAQGVQPQQAIYQAASETVQIYLAVTTINTPQMHHLVPQQVMSDFYGIRHRGQALQGEIQNARMMRQSGMGMGMGMGHPGGMGMTGGVPMMGSAGTMGFQPNQIPQGAMVSMSTPNVVARPAAPPMSTGRPSRLSGAAAPTPVTADQPAWMGGGQSQQTAVPTRAPGRYDVSGIDTPVTNQIHNIPPGQVAVPASKPTASSSGFSWGIAPAEPAPTSVYQPPVNEPVNHHDVAKTEESKQEGELPATVVTDMESPSQINDIERPYDYIVTSTGQEIAPAGLVEWEFTGTVDRPYRLAYDPSKYLLTLVRDNNDNTVTESLVEWNESMDYLDHELNADLARAERERRAIESGKRQVFQWQVVEALQPNAANTMSTQPDEEELAGLMENPDLIDVKLYSPEPGDVVMVETLGQGIKQAENAMRLAGRGGFNKEAVELYFDLPTLVVVPDERWANMVRLMAQSQSFNELHDRLVRLREMNDADTFDMLDRRITKVVNDALVDGMMLTGWSIDSFLADWVELISALTDKDGGSGEYVEQLDSYAMALIDSALSVMPDNVMQDYLIQQGHFDPEHAAALEDSAVGEVEHVEGAQPEPTAEEEEEEETEVTFEFPNAVVLVERVSVTTVPMTREEMSLRLDTGALVVPDYQPELHSALTAIFARTTEHRVAYAHRYLMTTDRQFIEIRRGILNPDAILLYDRGSLT